MPSLNVISEHFERAAGRFEYRALTWGAARAAGVHEETFSLAGVSVPVLLRDGVDAPMLLLHGFGADKEGWLPMAALLRRSRGLVIPDLPGFGVADAIEPASASARAQAAAVLSLLDHLAIERVHVVGNSMGGGIALRLAQDAPARIGSMTLIGSVGPIVIKSQFLLEVERGDNPLLVKDVADFDRMLRFVSERSLPAPRAIRRYLGAAYAARRTYLNGLFQGWIASAPDAGVPEDLERLSTRALILHGTQDRVIHASTAAALAHRLPNARLEFLEGVGHIPQIEAPLQVARHLERFVTEPSSNARVL
jgi:pimeloyl-ACP methyl ester carboxylesterase